MSNDDNNLVNSFFEVFAEPIKKTLSQNLDNDVCKDIKFLINSSSEVHDAESLKDDNVIYKIDYAMGEYPSTLVILVSESSVSNVADIQMGGSGDKEYKGSLSELETNSSSKLLEKIFKNIEGKFKQNYGKDLAFSSSPLFILKEMPDYEINSEDLAFDFKVDTTLQLSEDIKIDVKLLFNYNNMRVLLTDLGVFKVAPSAKKTDIPSLDIQNLSDVQINITAELGRTQVPIKYALELVKGSLITLDTLNNSDIKVYANGVEFGYAQVVAVEDSFGLKITKIVSREERLGQI